MYTSRLEQSSNALLTNRDLIREFSDGHGIPYATDFYSKILPDMELRAPFFNAYKMPPLPSYGLNTKGASTVLVFEPKMFKNNQESYHGEIVAAIAQTVGNNLATGIDALYVQAALNPNYRTAFKSEIAAIETLVENQGVPVIIHSVGWNDAWLVPSENLDKQFEHFRRATAFIVDSAGNEGRYGDPEECKILIPRQKHNIVAHAPPLVVHVGAASQQSDGTWQIEGYSAANSPTFLAPVPNHAKIVWRQGEEKIPQSVLGTSVSGPHAGGTLAALNRLCGAYLTREQILYAVIATCRPVTDVAAFGTQTPEAKKIEYKETAAGLAYNAEYGGFGLIDPYKAYHLLCHMAAQTQKRPEAITIPTEERITLEIGNGAHTHHFAAGDEFEGGGIGGVFSLDKHQGRSEISLDR